ncbi:MAG TPA: tetratricopeptide repeat protein [Kofleriaceae bacterium]|nr:tetratricopeptide repeat protein [Kofleriaceae bacterium]
MPPTNERRDVVGQVADGPWALILASFALSGRTGELVLTSSDAKLYRIAFVDGQVVAAFSPLAADSVARIALTSHLVSSTQVATIYKRIAASPQRDEVEVVAEAARLSDDQAARLRRRVLVQRTARTFSVDHGSFVFKPEVTLPYVPDVAVSIHAPIYLGIRMNLSETRLAHDLRQLGTRFLLPAGADVTPFELAHGDAPIVQSLRDGASLPELDALHREIAPRTAQAIVYALVACDVCKVTSVVSGEHEVPTSPSLSATITAEYLPEQIQQLADIEDMQSRTRTNTWPKPRPAATPIPERRVAQNTIPRTRTASGSGEIRPPAMARTRTESASPVAPRTITPREPEIRALIAAKHSLVQQHADHFTLLGVSSQEPMDVIRSAYVALLSHLQPDRLPTLDPVTTRMAHQVYAAINNAYRVIGDPALRAVYAASLHKSVQTKIVEDTLGAEQAFHRGLIALRREDLVEAVTELSRATQLAPNDVDYFAMLAWARFCAATDKHAIALDTRRALERAVHKSPKPMMARFYLGRVERMLGRIEEALYHFREVLEQEPGNVDAATEIRMLAPRVQAQRHRR